MSSVEFGKKMKTISIGCTRYKRESENENVNKRASENENVNKRAFEIENVR